MRLLHTHMEQLEMSFSILAETLNMDNVGKQQLRDIASGKAPPTQAIAAGLADALLMEGPERKKFLDAAYIAQPLEMMVKDYAHGRGAESVTAMAELFKVGFRVMSTILEQGRFQSRADTARFASQLGLEGPLRQSFFRIFGNCYIDDAHVMEDARTGRLRPSEIIKALCEIRGKDMKQFFAENNVPRSTYTKWSQSENGRNPTREWMIKLAGLDKDAPPGFAFNRQDAEAFVESAGSYIDPHHLVKRLEEGRIGFPAAIRSLLELRYESFRAAAEALGVQPLAVTKWAEGHIPRERLEMLTDKGIVREDKIALFEKGGYYVDADHINQSFAGSNRLDDFINACKTTFYMTNEDFRVNKHTVSNTLNTRHDPRPSTLAKQFVGIELLNLDVSRCWDTYKEVAARFLGISEQRQPHEYAQFMRNLQSAYTEEKASLAIGKKTDWKRE